ncbi:MAG: NADH-quinone oxidoreductase subunit I [Fibromonadaceae bacterium]|jgi:NADH-quinone oxidoreductase subunit I|nr:NADH-quinone oxidoreductase subunit I [Fibromonadaceae bacterium]
MPRIVQHPERTLWVQAYVPEAIRGLYTTLRHFLRGLLKYETLPTIPYPDIKPPIPEDYRSRHRLLKRDDGTPRCVACGMCAAACPARCIKVEAGEHDGQVEKRAICFEIDHLTCVFCGLCVEACPADAIRMDTGMNSFVHDNRQKFLTNMEDLLRF